MIGETLCFFAGNFQTTVFTELVEYFKDVTYLEIEWFADQVRTVPANRHVSVATFGTDDGLHFQLLGSVNDTLYQFSGNIGYADLDAAIGCFKWSS